MTDRPNSRTNAAMRTPLLLVAVFVTTVPAAASANESLAKAEKLVSALKYADAIRYLQEAWNVPENDRKTVVRILELEAIANATLHREDQAQKLFRMLLSIDPDHGLGTDLSPRVKTPFYEAKSWLAEHAPLRVEPTGDGRPGIRVKSDPFQMAKKARFHILVNGAWEPIDATLKGGRAQPDLGPQVASVRWWAQTLNEWNGALVDLGSEASPLGEGVSTASKNPPPSSAGFEPAPASAPPEPRLVAEVPPPPVVVAPSVVGAAPVSPPVEAAPTRTPSEPRFRAGAYVLLGIGAAALAGGGVFGYLSNQANAQLQGVDPGGSGVVSGMSQNQAYQLRDQRVLDATVANVLFIAGGAVALTGGIVWVVGSVSVEPAPGGVAVSGTF